MHQPHENIKRCRSLQEVKETKTIRKLEYTTVPCTKLAGRPVLLKPPPLNLDYLLPYIKPIKTMQSEYKKGRIILELNDHYFLSLTHLTAMQFCNRIDTKTQWGVAFYEVKGEKKLSYGNHHIIR